jgi:hypothetical protein
MGKFIQKTLVHFEVEEAFKGLGPEMHDVWVDPGSFTSCYAEYHVGERYLVFAYGGAVLPKRIVRQFLLLPENPRPSQLRLE